MYFTNDSVSVQVFNLLTLQYLNKKDLSQKENQRTVYKAISRCIMNVEKNRITKIQFVISIFPLVCDFRLCLADP